MFSNPTVAAYVDRWIGNVSFDLAGYAAFAISLWFTLWVVLRAPMAGRKIRAATPRFRQLVTEFAISLRTLAIFSTIGVGLFALERNGLFTGPSLAASRGWGWAILSLLLMIVAHDAYFYWTHRAMHDRRLLRWFHRRHHKSHNPSPFSAYSFDLSEAVVQAVFVPIWLLAVPTSWPVVGLFMVHQIARNTFGHCGYEVYPANAAGRPLLAFVTSTTHHDLHHAQGRYNFGLYFTWWDRWMGTEHPEYLARYAAVAGPRRLRGAK